MEEPDGKALRDDALAGGERGKRAFERLWRAWWPRLCWFASTWRGLPDAEREDAVADALVRAYGSLGAYDPSRPLAPWLYRIAARRFSDAARAASRHSTLALDPAGDEASWDPPSGEDHARELETRDLADRCRAAMARLPGADRRIAWLRFRDGLDASAIGRALGLPAGTVRWRLHLIRKTVGTAVGVDDEA